MRTAPMRSLKVVRYGAASTSRAAKADSCDAAPSSVDDHVITEEPLEIRLAGDTLAITMRTPGNDRELVLGFLWAEGVITSLDQVAGIVHCGPLNSDQFENCIDVTPSETMRLTQAAHVGLRRGTMTTSACGVCGRRTIDDLLARCAPVASATTMTTAALAHAALRLKQAQPLFAECGGCHGAALVNVRGEVIAAYEDVGRHNAVDKLIGAQLLASDNATSGFAASAALIVSGRTSFEIVQKAVAAGIGIVAGISAASSLAIDTAQRARVTLVGFVRNSELVIYTHPERITR